MERRTALALATAAAGTVLAASAAFAANVGLLEQDPKPPISVLDTSSLGTTAPTDPTVVTIIVEDPPLQSVAPAAAPSVAPAAPVQVSGSDDDHGDDSDYEDSDSDDDGYEDSDYEDDDRYEGADDDDD